MAVTTSPWEAQYRRALLDQPLVSKVILADGQLVEVKDIYVHRALLHEVVQKQPEREIMVKLSVELWSKLRDERVVLVEGPAGTGKTTLTKHLVQESETHHLLPIWIPFRPFADSGLSILEYLDQRYIPGLGLSDLRVPDHADKTGRGRSLGQWCYDQWQSGLGVLILDGLDEVFRHEKRVAALKALPITGIGRTRPATILTSRPLSQSIPLQLVKVDIQGLTPADQTQFIKQYRATLRLTEKQITRFTSTTQKQGRPQSLLMRPGHLIQILTTYARTNTILDTETAVLNNLLESRLTITGRSQPPVEGNDEKKKRQVLLSLALHLLACRQGQRQTRAQLLALIQQVLREHATNHAPLFPLAQATALLHDLVHNSGLLTEVEHEVYECETVIWLQHLTGTALADERAIAPLVLTESKVLDFLDRKAWDPEWEPVLKSWVGQAHNPLPLFDRLMKKEHDDLTRHRLGVAGHCLVEVQVDLQPHSHYQVLAERIPTESFALWKENVKRNSERLVTTSLGRAWVETEVGQTLLLALLQSPRSTMRRQAIETLNFLQPIMPRAMQGWVDEVEEQDRAVRTAAVEALGWLGAAMPVPVQMALVARLADPNEDVRGAAVGALGKLGTAMPVSAQQALVVRLADANEHVRQAAVAALHELKGAMADTVQMALAARLADPNEDVRRAVVQVFWKLGTTMPVSVQQALVERLADANERVREAAVAALGELGAAMPVSLQQALVARLTDSDRRVCSAAALTIFGLGAAMPVPVQQAVMARLTDLWNEAVVSDLGGLRAASMRRACLAWLADLDWNLRRAAAMALGKLEAAMPVPVQQALVAWLTNPDEAMRRAAADALGELGMAMAVPVRQALVARLADLDRTVRGAAATALSSAQQQGLRFFLSDSVVVPCRVVSELSATAPLSDMCHEGNVHAPATLAPVAFHRLSLTAV